MVFSPSTFWFAARSGVPGRSESLMVLTVTQPLNVSAVRINTALFFYTLAALLPHRSGAVLDSARSTFFLTRILGFRARQSPKVWPPGGKRKKRAGGPSRPRVLHYYVFFFSVFPFPSKRVPESGADRWSACVTVCSVLSGRCVEGRTEPPAAARGRSIAERWQGGGGGRGRGRGGAVRKLSPYDVFPASQRRFRRDTGRRGGGRERSPILWE